MLIKNKLIAVLLVLSMILGGFIWFQQKSITDLNKSLRIEANNYKSATQKNRVYVLQIDELKNSKDSSDLKVKMLIDELKIKPKKVTETVYINSQTQIKDTITLKDSVFIRDYEDKTGDEWYSLDLKFKAPNTFNVNLKMRNELICIVSDKRETIKPRKKFFISRWFQRKQTVQVINVKELNPHSTVQDFKFINIIK